MHRIQGLGEGYGLGLHTYFTFNYNNHGVLQKEPTLLTPVCMSGHFPFLNNFENFNTIRTMSYSIELLAFKFL